MHQLASWANLSSEGISYPLMAKANAQGWCFRADGLQDIEAHSEILDLIWSSGAGRDYDPVRAHLFNLTGCDGVVPAHDRFGAKLPHVLGEVVNERVEVIND